MLTKLLFVAVFAMTLFFCLFLKKNFFNLRVTCLVICAYVSFDFYIVLFNVCVKQQSVLANK